ncbi:hypothetical protein EVAR_99719_1 [Eumeta japonica]|uniref:Uncharacterized protein n=1 Tax=Eumeta variegata TaxID=151549 RepID=A0A4C1ZI64_EUMVA|nr:hypothetical protein EVAR_99719_1 [Eumeta japonica]
MLDTTKNDFLGYSLTGVVAEPAAWRCEPCARPAYYRRAHAASARSQFVCARRRTNKLTFITDTGIVVPHPNQLMNFFYPQPQDNCVRCRRRSTDSFSTCAVQTNQIEASHYA